MKDVLGYIENNKERYLKELTEFLAIPSVSTNPENAGDIRRCADWVADHLRSIGIPDVRIMATPGHPVVYGAWMDAPGKPTVLIYGHYDVQPPEPLELWTSPPFEATVRGEDLYARGASDDKGQVFIHLKAIEAMMRTTGTLPVNVKFIIEGEEEIGSEHLDEFVKTHADLLKADLVMVSDTSMFARGVPSICYGLRGLAYMQLDLVGPKGDLHSGSYGGSILNPIQALAEIIAKLHDGKGRITIPGFYDDVRALSKKERDAYKKLPWSDRKYAKDLGVKELYGERGFTTLERLWARPTLECNGIWGGFTGEGAKTVLPSKASAKISMRLVPDQSSKKVSALFTKYIRKIAPPGVTVTVQSLHGGEPAITPIDSPGVRAAYAALEKGFGKKPLYQREGGSIPIVVQFKKLLKIDTVLLGFGLPDENAHAPDEFMHLPNFFGGIRTAAHFLNELPAFMKKGAEPGGLRMLRVNILLHVHTVGLRRDLRVFRAVLRGRPVELTITAFDPALAPRLRRGVRRAIYTLLPRKRYDINVFVEEISEQWLPFARVNCLMPHQEWLSEGSRALLSRLDVVLSKTHFAERLFAELGLRSIYTGFTTLDRYNPGIRKDFGACIHVAGSSLQKGSMAVNRTWLDNPSFPTLEMYWYEPSARPIGASNIRLERGFLRERVIHEAQNHCGIHLCPSEAEGYGHYLAEAMSCGALVVSTDAPPMNELVTNERGVLVGYDRVAPQAVGTNFYVDEQKLAVAMRGIFAMPIEERKRLGEAARSWFVENDRAFRNRFWEVLQGLA